MRKLIAIVAAILFTGMGVLTIAGAKDTTKDASQADQTAGTIHAVALTLDDHIAGFILVGSKGEVLAISRRECEADEQCVSIVKGLLIKHQIEVVALQSADCNPQT